MNRQKNTARIYPLTHPIKAAITVPGSKSYTNRALIIASLANGKSILSGCSNSNDSLNLIQSLQQLGIDIVCDKNEITIAGNNGNFKEFHENNIFIFFKRLNLFIKMTFITVSLINNNPSLIFNMNVS